MTTSIHHTKTFRINKQFLIWTFFLRILKSKSDDKTQTLQPNYANEPKKKQQFPSASRYINIKFYCEYRIGVNLEMCAIRDLHRQSGHSRFRWKKKRSAILTRYK